MMHKNKLTNSSKFSRNLIRRFLKQALNIHQTVFKNSVREINQNYLFIIMNLNDFNPWSCLIFFLNLNFEMINFKLKKHIYFKWNET